MNDFLFATAILFAGAFLGAYAVLTDPELRSQECEIHANQNPAQK